MKKRIVKLIFTPFVWQIRRPHDVLARPGADIRPLGRTQRARHRQLPQHGHRLHARQPSGTGACQGLACFTSGVASTTMPNSGSTYVDVRWTSTKEHKLSHINLALQSQFISTRPNKQAFKQCGLILRNKSPVITALYVRSCSKERKNVEHVRTRELSFRRDDVLWSIALTLESQIAHAHAL